MSSVEVEIMFVSVERMLSYMELPTEAPRHTDLRPPEDWPKRGQVEFRNMSLAYPGGKAPVLKNVSVKIKVFNVKLLNLTRTRLTEINWYRR